MSSPGVRARPRPARGADLAEWATAIAAARAELVALLVRARARRPSRPTPTTCSCPRLRVCATTSPRGAVLVRDTATFGLAGGARIAVPDPAGLDRSPTP